MADEQARKRPEKRQRPSTVPSEPSSSSETVIWDVRPMDVLVGRESLDAWHEGTLQFLALIDSLIPTYMSCKGRLQKTLIIQQLYNAVATQHRRFLTRHPTEMLGYVQVNERAAKEKISHIIRYRVRHNQRATTHPSPTAPTAAGRSIASEQQQFNTIVSSSLTTSDKTTTVNPQSRSRDTSQIVQPEMQQYQESPKPVAQAPQEAPSTQPNDSSRGLDQLQESNDHRVSNTSTTSSSPSPSSSSSSHLDNFASALEHVPIDAFSFSSSNGSSSTVRRDCTSGEEELFSDQDLNMVLGNMFDEKQK